MIAKEALTYAFDILKLDSVYAEVLKTNAASILFHEKIGFIEKETNNTTIRYVYQRKESILKPIAESYVLANSKKWNAKAAQNLQETTNKIFHSITDKYQLNLDYLKKLNPQYIFFPHWSYIIPQEVYENYECIVFHMTDVPYGRGGSPLQNLILRGHESTQISALRCVAELDAGPIYMKRPLILHGTAQEIYMRATEVIEEMIIYIIENSPQPVEQQGEVVNFKRRKPEQSDLAGAEIGNIKNFYDFIRMLDADGYPKAFIDMHKHKIEFSDARLENGKLVGTFEIKNIDKDK